MRPKYTVSKEKIDGFHCVKIIAQNNSYTNFVALPSDSIDMFCTMNGIEPSQILAAGDLDLDETPTGLDNLIPHCYVHDPNYGVTKSFVCVQSDGWDKRPIHQDVRSAFKCIIEKLHNATSLFVYTTNPTKCKI